MVSLLTLSWISSMQREHRLMAQYQPLIEEALQEREQEAIQWMSDLNDLPSDLLEVYPGNILQYQGDSLIGWTGNSVYFPDTPPSLDSLPGMFSFSSGWFEVRAKQAGNLTTYYLLPFYRHFSPEHPSLKNGFPDIRKISRGVQPSFQTSSYPIQSTEGKTLVYLNQTAPLKDPLWSLFAFIALLVMGLSLAVLLNSLAILVAKRFSPWLGAGTLLVLLAIIQYLGRYGQLQEQLAGLPFHETLGTVVLNGTLGDLLLNTALLLWLMIFIHREFSAVSFGSISRHLAIFLSSLNYLAILIGLLVIINTFQNLILNADISFDFDNVFNLELNSFLAIIGMVLLLLALFLFSHRMMLTIFELPLPTFWRRTGFALGMMFAIPVYFLLGSSIPLWQFFVIGLFFCGLLDFFVEDNRPNLTWLLIWLALFAGLASTLLFQFKTAKDQRIRTELADALITGKDPLRDHQLELLENDLRQGKNLEETLPNYPYLDRYYSLDLQPTGELTWELTKGATSSSSVFTDLLDGANFKGLEKLDRFDWALYRNEKRLVFNHLNSFPTFFPQERANSLHEQILSIGDREALVVVDGTDTILIGKQKDTLLKSISLFSFLFVILLLTIPVFSFLNNRLRALPSSLDFTIVRQPSLRNRIQLWVIGLSLVSFIVIGWFTVQFYQNSFYYNQELKIKDQITTLLREPLLQTADSLSGSAQLVENLGKVHQVDLHLYSPKGRLLVSTIPGLFRNGWKAPLLKPSALSELTTSGKEFIVQEDHISQFSYQSAYLPVKNQEGQLQGILSMPFFAEQQQLQQEVSSFIGTLLNVYVLLLIIGGVIAIVAANSITQPLADLSVRLSQLKLGKNEPLYWNRNDELGALVAEYNRMLEKLEESTTKLAQSERESAWREMAKQVAHEIKNPLTPMKLSIQYLQHAYRSQPEQAEALIKRVSSTLVEQIDALSKIASEFSAFAKMPKPENSRFILNNLIQSTHDLFAQERPEMAFPIEMPNKTIEVFADRDQLMRVLNNLYKNAIQAIPNEKTGAIQTQITVQAEKIIIAIQDNGTGISEETREKVFVPNFTTKSSGTGLGLAMSKNIIESAGGAIYFETESGVGTTFFVELPPAPNST
jgi:signal transduction histidine kinase